MKFAARALTGMLLTLTLLTAFAPPAALAQGDAAFTAKAPTTTAALIVAADAARVGVEIINTGSVTVYLGSSSVTSSTGYPVFANGRVKLKGVKNAIYGVTASGTGALRVSSLRGGEADIESSSLAYSLAYYSDVALGTDVVTVATTGNTDSYMVVPFAASLSGVDCSGTSALAASDTNYVTLSVTNLGQAGAGSTALLASADANTTKATGGTALSANSKRSLTLHGTAANLIVAAGDRLLFRAAATGTLAGTVTFWKCTARFNRLT